MKYAAIADWATEGEYPVTFMCAQLGVARQGYYRWLKTGPSQRERTDAELTDTIREIHHDLRGDPGVRRVWAELVARGHRTARKRVWRLMRAAGLQGRHPHTWRKTTVAGLRPIDAPDLIGRDFTAEAPDTRWCGDITYIQTVDGWAYLATVIDLHSRKVVGYAVADHLRTNLITEALAAALLTRRPPAGVIMHSDRGTQYTSREFTDFCAANNVARSMGRRATCFDNAVAESFFASYKKELIHTRPWNDVTEVRQQTFAWIESYYNRRRRHSTLEYLTPTEYELGFRKITDLAA
ncbi:MULTISPECIES: IS3 family transposase [unclassified Pseudonocardia]|nr:IS3 family transposase [Pseudonocardia sp. Ae331_Ps2]OLL89699.1 Mobile element protein [Pseudonocardia sp. Ae331_Ps2]OLL89704.1 Mobile element protein [Pseudonocardia sp. Ae331_Ps2]